MKAEMQCPDSAAVCLCMCVTDQTTLAQVQIAQAALNGMVSGLSNNQPPPPPTGGAQGQQGQNQGARR